MGKKDITNFMKSKSLIKKEMNLEFNITGYFL